MSRATLVLLMLAFAPGGCAKKPPERVLRVCADPNNLPFSDKEERGFENRIAEVLARELGARLEYTWWAQRRGFFRETLGAQKCDVVIGVPAGFERALTTRPYYRSSYVFVTRMEQRFQLHSLDDPRLHALKIGVQLVGDDGANTPPAHALARRGLVENVVGFTVYGDYGEPSPPANIIHAVERGDIDVGLVWGPLAGSFARDGGGSELAINVIQPELADAYFTFDICVGVRKGQRALLLELQRALDRRHGEIQEILLEAGVPLLTLDTREASR